MVNDSKRDSIHLNWSDLVPIDMEAEYQRLYSRKRLDARAHTTTLLTAFAAEAATVPPSSPATHKTIKNIVLVPFMPKPKDWGSWQIKRSQLASSTGVTPNSVHEEQDSDQEQQEQQQEEIELVYQPHSPYYLLVHPPEF